jgi:hypothetical protein
MEAVTHHVREEENEVLPKMQESLGVERMTALGDQLAQAKRQEMGRHRSYIRPDEKRALPPRSECRDTGAVRSPGVHRRDQWSYTSRP